MEDHPGRIHPLYNDRSALSYKLDANRDRAQAAASALPSAKIADRQSAIEALRQKFEIAGLTIHVDQAKTTTGPKDVIVPPKNGGSQNWGGDDVMQAGLEVVVTVPYSGSRMLLQHEASRQQDFDARTRLLDGEIEFSKTFTMPVDADTIKAWRTDTLATIAANADAANADVRAHNEQVLNILPAVLDKRHADLDALRKVAEELD